MIALLIVLLIQSMTATNQQAKLIYVGDPMCSWCYGIAPELAKVKKQIEGKTEFEVVLGGLRPYNTETMSDLKSFLTDHWEDVHNASGQPFQYGILNSDDITYDTEPPCRATVVVRELKPEAAFDFFKSIQRDFYYENKNMHLVDSYTETLEQLDIDKDAFASAFQSDKMKQLVQKDFERAEQLGVRSFPTILLEVDGQRHMIAQGYSTAADMMARINHHLKK